MTVFQNIAFGLKIRRRPKAEVRERVHELLELVQLEGMADRYPSQLSGGQRQRMGLARALAVEPEVLLLDEPFGALDAQVRKELRAWLRRLHDETHTTTVIVTHDQEEAMEVAETVAVMNRGKIEQVAGPIELYEHPANEFVMEFVGAVNRARGHVHTAARPRGEARAERDDEGGEDRRPRSARLRRAARARPRRRRAALGAVDARAGGSHGARTGQDRLRQADAPDDLLVIRSPGRSPGDPLEPV